MNVAVLRSTSLQRIGAVASGFALAAAAATVAVADPAAAGSRFPRCTFRAMTGLWCPGCGLTRGTHQLLRGDLPAALGSNVFTPFALTAIVLAWWVWMANAFGRPTRNPIERWPRWATPTLLAVVLAYGVVRNVPLPGLRALAP